MTGTTIHAVMDRGLVQMIQWLKILLKQKDRGLSEAKKRWF